MMMRQPRFKPCFRCEIVPSDGVFLISENEHFLLRGEAYIGLAPLLDGKHTVEEIIDILHNEISAPEVFYLLDRLQSKGYLVDAKTSIPSEQAAFWEMLGKDSEQVAQRLQEVTVSVVSFGQIDAEPFKTMLTSLGVRVGEGGEHWVVLTDDYLQEGLDAFNQDALSCDRSWMLVKPVGIEMWVGPVFIPSKTGCWECLAHRLRGHRKVERYLQQRKNTTQPLPTSLSALPSTLSTILSLAATETVKWVVCSQNESLEGNIVTLNALSLEKCNHVLVRRPQCPRCGVPRELLPSLSKGEVGGEVRQSAAIALQSRKKSFTRDGGHRSVSPEQTFKTFAHHISPITGIIGVLRQASTWEDEAGLTPSYSAGYGFIDTLDDLNGLQESLRSESYGKGRSNIQAKVSALCEAIERYTAIFQGDEPRIRARFKDLGTAIHPNACMLFSDRQFQNRDRLNGNRISFDWIPERFDEDREIEWSPAWSLTYNEVRYIPTAYCYSGYSQKYNTLFASADTNGCATGNNLEEAILQGFMELVERDSIALWWYNRLPKPAVELSSFDEPYFQELLTFYKKLHRDLWVLDITSDLNIPAFAAISRRNDQPEENIILGFGAHFDPRLAVLRALTELNQSLPATFFGMFAPNQAYRDRDREAINWWKTAAIANQPYLLPDQTSTPKTQADYPRQWSDDIYIDVKNCVGIAEAQGWETVVLDMTRPDLGLSVVKVIVPGLRHFWPRFGAGRLYDIPVKMGWLTKPLTEEQLNPLPAFF
ncbi:MAG: TOMM precursor leader peptide-binding protein [Cyanobacteriota bacterium]